MPKLRIIFGEIFFAWRNLSLLVPCTWTFQWCFRLAPPGSCLVGQSLSLAVPMTDIYWDLRFSCWYQWRLKCSWVFCCVGWYVWEETASCILLMLEGTGSLEMSETGPEDITLPKAVSFTLETIFKPSDVHYSLYKVFIVTVLKHSGNCT